MNLINNGYKRFYKIIFIKNIRFCRIFPWLYSPITLNWFYKIKKLKVKRNKTVFFWRILDLWVEKSKEFRIQRTRNYTWIESFDSKDTLIDIGANIGIYTIYAAKRGHRIIAFEPESQNFGLLNRHISLNNVDN